MALIGQEVSMEREIGIPGEVREIYKQWRPILLHRARRLEKALDTPAKIYYKYGRAAPPDPTSQIRFSLRLITTIKRKA